MITLRWNDDTTDLDALIISFYNAPTDANCDALTTYMINTQLDFDLLDTIYCIATTIDPDETGHAAHIRDTIRDNYSHITGVI